MATPSAKDMLMQVKRYAEGGPVQSDGLIRALAGNPSAGKAPITEEQYYANIRSYAAANTNPLEALNAMTAGGVSMADANRALGAKAVSDYFTIDPNQGEKAPSAAVATNYISPLQQAFLDTPNKGQEVLDARIREVAQQNAGNPEALRNLFVQERANIADLQRAGVDPSILYATVAQKPIPTPPTPTPTPTPLPTLPVIPPYTPPVVTPQTQIQYPQPTPYTATSVYQPIAAPPPIYGAGQPALDVPFRNSAPRSEYGSYGYTYTPAASLLPATGAGMSWTPPSVTSRPRSLLKVPLPTAANPQYSASQQFARDRAAAQLAALPVGGGGRFSGMQAPVAPPLDPNAPVDPYGVKATEFRNFAPPPLTGVAKAAGGEIKKSEGTADPSARAMLNNLDSDAPVKRNLPKEAQDARRARIGQAPAVAQDYSGRDLTGELLNVASLVTTPLPVAGDLMGLAADARMYQMHPEERTMGNYLLSGFGVLPFVPSVSAVKTAGKGVKTAAADLLDLSQGAKAARQVEQGYAPQDFYHATYKGFDAFDPDMVGLGTHIGTAEQANNRLKFFSKNLAGPGAEIGSNIIPLKARLGKTLEMNDVGQWNDSFDVLRSFRRNMEETNLEDYSESISDGVRDFSHPITFDKKQLQRVDDLLAESDEMQAEYRDAITTPIKFKSFLLDESDQMQVEYSDDITAWIKSPENKELLDKTKKLIQGMGYDSIRYINRVENAPDNFDFSYIVLDPKNLRAKTADYDPSKLESSDLGHAKGGPVQKYATGNEVSSNTKDLIAQMNAVGARPNTPTPDPDPVKTESQNMLQRFTSLNTPKDMSLGETLADIAMGFAPAIGTAQGARDFERARRDNDTLGMVLGAASMIPVGGGTVKAVKGIAKGVKTAAEELADLAPLAAKAPPVSVVQRAATRGPLDKTLEARMARAAEQGYTGPLYHGTADIENEGFDEFNKKFYGSVTNSPSAKMGTWLTDDPNTANIYASFAPFSALENLKNDYEKISDKLFFKKSKLEGEARTAAREKDKLKRALLADKIKQVSKELMEGVPDPAEEMKYFPLPIRIGGGGGASIMPVRARGNFMEYDAGDTSIRELRDKKGLTKLGKEAKEAGYDGLKITNFRDPMTAPSATHYLVFDTKNIRSEYADYDPSKLESSNLGHADGGLIQKYATGNEVSSNTKDLIAQMNAVGDMPNTKTPDPASDPVKTKSAGMLDNLIRAYEQNISKPAVGSVIDMTLGLGDLGQMGAKYLANRAGIKTDPFVSTAERAHAAAGTTGYDPYTIGGITTNLLPFARGKQVVGGAAKTFASMFPNLVPEALSYAGGEAAAAAAREVLPDSTLAQVVAGGAGSIAAGRGGSPTMSNMAVKNKGGNWPSGSVENALNGLKGLEAPLYTHINDRGQAVAKEYGRAMTTAELENTYGPASWARFERNKPLNNWVNKTLTKYVKNDMGTPEDPLRIMADKYAVDKPAKLAEVQGRIDAFAAKMEQTARDRGVPVGDLTSMRQQMIGLEKEKALVEARQGLHFEPQGRNPQVRQGLRHIREMEGFPSAGLGKSELAQRWETLTDVSISPADARTFLSTYNWENVPTVENNPWLLKVPSETKVYELSAGRRPETLGFDHLIDELRNAVDPNSGLPKELLIDLKDLPKITMEQAVNRVADIDAWRSVNRAEANFAIANNPATFIHKQYPDGMKWVQIKLPETPQELPEGWSTPVAKGGMLQAKSVDGKSVLGNDLPDIIKNIYRRHPETPGSPRKLLEDALKYEGDTMINCVGGGAYCDRVIGGASEIFSLRNAEGQPFATIEVQPQSVRDYYDNLGPNKQHEFMGKAIEYRRQTDPDWDGNSNESERFKMRREYVQAQNIKIPSIIRQIKGLNNGVVEEKYWPLVQDFVNSGTWSEVKEYRNAGLVKIGVNSELAGRLRQKGIAVPSYATNREITNLLGQAQITAYQDAYSGKTIFAEPPPEEFAGGGPITKKAKGGNVERVYNDRKYI